MALGKRQSVGWDWLCNCGTSSGISFIQPWRNDFGKYGGSRNFWAILGFKTTLLAPGLAAVGIALINSTGNLGGFTGPFLTGYLKDLTGSLSWGLGLYGCTSLIAAFLTMILQLKKIGK